MNGRLWPLERINVGIVARIDWLAGANTSVAVCFLESVFVLDDSPSACPLPVRIIRIWRSPTARSSSPTCLSCSAFISLFLRDRVRVRVARMLRASRTTLWKRFSNQYRRMKTTNVLMKIGVQMQVMSMTATCWYRFRVLISILENSQQLVHGALVGTHVFSPLWVAAPLAKKSASV